MRHIVSGRAVSVFEAVATISVVHVDCGSNNGTQGATLRVICSYDKLMKHVPIP